jgi:Uma2 family endonuclease
MLTIQDILIDDTLKPAIEWIHGKAVQKVMPTDWHAILQLGFGRIISDWMDVENPRGSVGAEWRFVVPPNSFKTESLVPDIAYLSTYFDLPRRDRKYPSVPPDIAIEILSPDDLKSEVESRTRFYLWWGVRVVLIVDPDQRSVELHESPDTFTTFTEHETLTTTTFPSLAIQLGPIFSRLDEPK